MKTAALVVGTILAVGGLCGFAWPFPLFTLNEPYLTWYMENVLQVDNTPGGAGAALPFVWMFTLLPSLLALVIGGALVGWAKGQ